MASGIGYIAAVVKKVRKWVFDPATGGRFTDTEIIDYIRLAFEDVVAQINRASQKKLRSRIEIPIVGGTSYYSLPPTIGQFLAFEERDAVTGSLLSEIVPNHPLSPYGPNFTIEGPVLRFEPVPQENRTFTIVYVPNGSGSPFEAEAASNEHTSTTALLPIGGPVDAAMFVDYRENAYAGYIFRSLSATYAGPPAHTIVQDRVVTGFTVYNGAQRAELTFKPALSPAPDVTQPMTFEVIPDHAYRMESLVALRVARFISSIMPDPQRRAGLDAEFVQQIRDTKLMRAQFDARKGQSFKRRMRGRRRLG